MTGETIEITGFNNDKIDAYLARPSGAGPYPAVVVLHHAPGWDEWCMEATRKFAHHGFAAICPNLHHRVGPGSAEDMAAAVRDRGGMPDEQVMGDIQGAVNFLATQTYHNGKTGVIGFCSGGRQSYLAACKVTGMAAAVDCWGGRVWVPEEDRNGKPAAIDFTGEMSVPLLGLFGNDDQNPAPAQVDLIEAALKKNGKTYEFHRYDGAGHGFFATDRPGYRPVQAVDGWKKVFAWYDKYLG
ncbi:MAG: dienelactone hydrolase family protein [Chloroflexi bacterium]|nr:dienelactone hydrolase family protein [Chloroflexota bacterium]